MIGAVNGPIVSTLNALGFESSAMRSKAFYVVAFLVAAGPRLADPRHFNTFSGSKLVPNPNMISSWGDLTVEQLISLTPRSIDEIPVPTFETLTASVIQVLDPEVIASLRDYQLERMPDGEKDALDPKLREKLPIPPPKPGPIRGLIMGIGAFLSSDKRASILKHNLKVGIGAKILIIYLITLCVELVRLFSKLVVLWVERVILDSLSFLYRNIIGKSFIHRWLKAIIHLLHGLFSSINAYISQFIKYLGRDDFTLYNLIMWVLQAAGRAISDALKGIPLFGPILERIVLKFSKEQE